MNSVLKFTVFFIVILLAVLLLTMTVRQIHRWRRKPLLVTGGAAAVIYGALLVIAPEPWWLVDIVILGVSAAGGSVLGLLLTSRVSIITFCVAAALADVLSVSGGATAAIIRAWDQGSSTLLSFLAISVPLSGTRQPVIGIGDLLVVAALCFALLRLGYRPWVAVVAPLAGVLAAFTTALLVGGVAAIPFIAIVTIAALLRVPVREP